MRAIFKQIKGVDNLEFPRIKYDDAMALYGSDKPDLRFGNPMSDISELFANTEFKVFKDVLSNNGVIKAIKFSNIEYSRKEIDKLTEFVKIYGAKGLAYLKKDNDTYSGSLNNAFSEEEKNSLGLNNKDIMFIDSGHLKTVNAALVSFRAMVAHEKNLI